MKNFIELTIDNHNNDKTLVNILCITQIMPWGTGTRIFLSGDVHTDVKESYNTIRGMISEAIRPSPDRRMTIS